MKKTFSTKDEQMMIDLYNSGKSIIEISKIYEVSTTPIRRILLGNNVLLRDHSHKKRKYSLDENYFDIIDSPNKAYILGLLFADGCNSENIHNIKLELQERDRHIVESVAKELCTNKPLKTIRLHDKNPAWQNTCQLIVTNKHMSETLSQHGMVPNKSLMLNFPTSIPENLYSHFIRGYFDGDGHIEWSKSKFLTIASTRQFCEAIKDICYRFLGISTTIYDTANKNSNTKILHVFSKARILKFLDFIYGDAELYIDRKYKSYQLIRNELVSECK